VFSILHCKNCVYLCIYDLVHTLLPLWHTYGLMEWMYICMYGVTDVVNRVIIWSHKSSTSKVYSVYFYYVSTSYGVSYLSQSSVINIH